VARELSIGCCVAVAMFWLGLVSPSVAAYDDFKIVVHRDNPSSAVDRDFLRDIYLRRATQWRDGEAIRPIDLPKAAPSYEHFARAVLRKTPEQLRNFWVQRIFSGTGMPPTGAPSISAAIEYVLANRGAVSYLPMDVDPRGTKVIQIR
jgi:ABC-type phosphate transport system substrate-binding protein